MELYTVTVKGPGRSKWRVTVRAGDERGAGEILSARGHVVLAVRRGAARLRGPVVPARAVCVKCGYSLVDLPPGAASEVMCPECGVVNLPDVLESEQVARIRARGRTRRRVAWLVVAAGLGAWLVGMLLRVWR